MGKSRRRLDIMRSLLISLVLLVLSVQADDFKGQKVTLGKRKCTCDFRLDMKETCKGTAKCDKKCSGAGKVEVGGCSFALQVKKGNGKISKCKCQAAQPTIGPITGSGSGPAPPTGSGSGPSPPVGSGSGEQPVPLPGSGSGSGPGPQPPAGGEGMQCACKCDCAPGSGECDCDCNCPMNSQAVNCAPGFSKVCPMMGDQCPPSMEQVCPSMPTTMPMPAGRMMGAGDRGCQCVPDFLLSLVMGAMTPAGRSAAVDRAMTKVTFKIGKTTCKCQYDINEKVCKRSKFACDKKCNGKISGLELDGGNYVMNLMVKKGKVAIQKCEAKTTEPTGTGGGPGSGPGNGGGSGMGSGPGSGIGGGMGGMGTRCACVSMGGGPMPPTGSGSGPMPPTGSGPSTFPPPCSQGRCIPPPEYLCPEERPDFGSRCDLPPTTCYYGNQTCCGESSAEYVMKCADGEWNGFYIDTPCILGQPCPTPSPTTAPNCICPAVFSPVCGTDGNTYSNQCFASCKGIKPSCEGSCPCGTDCICPAVVDPVCGEDGKTYNNSCEAGCVSVNVNCQGSCPC